MVTSDPVDLFSLRDWVRTFYLQCLLGRNSVCRWWGAKERCSDKHSSRPSPDRPNFLLHLPQWRLKTAMDFCFVDVLCCWDKGEVFWGSSWDVFLCNKRREEHTEKSLLYPHVPSENTVMLTLAIWSCSSCLVTMRKQENVRNTNPGPNIWNYPLQTSCWVNENVFRISVIACWVFSYL